MSDVGIVADPPQNTGPVTWGLYQHTADPQRFIETYTVGSWSEHLAQRHNRCTRVDHDFELHARDLVEAGPQVTHALTRTARHSRG